MFEGQMAKAFEALERKDLHAVMRGFADEAVFEFPGHTPISGRHEGKPAIEAFFRALFERLETWHFTIRHVGMANPIGLNYTNTLYIEYEVDEASTGGQVAHNRGITVMEFRHCKVVLGRDYFFDPTVVERLFASTEAPGAA